MRRRRSSAISRQIRTLVFTDLDGTLLAHDSYSWAGACPAMEQLRHRRIPLIFCSSKTRAEVLALRHAIGNTDPFVVENGALIEIPAGCLLPANRTPGSACTLVLGRSYEQTVGTLRTIARRAGVRIRGFHQMTAEEVALTTGLSVKQARLARKRESGEPFVFQSARPAQIRTFIQLAHEQGYSLQRGGRFWHISGGCDKGLAVSTLIGLYRARWRTPVRTVALGDSSNDLPMLEWVDRPILMPKPDGSFDEEVSSALPRIRHAREFGPAGWGRAVLEEVQDPKSLVRSLSTRKSPT